MVQRIFMTILDMSIAAGYCAVFVILARLLMRKLPKSYSYALWAIVFVRLMLPVVPERNWSLLPEKGLTVSEQVLDVWRTSDVQQADMEQQTGEKQQVGVEQQTCEKQQVNIEQQTSEKLQVNIEQQMDEAQQIGGEQPDLGSIRAEENLAEQSAGLFVADGDVNKNANTELSLSGKVLTVLSGMWLCVGMLLVGYGISSGLLLKRRLKGAVQVEKGIYELEHLPTAFVTGFIRQWIYLPAGLPEEQRRYVLAHEMVHRKRGDVRVKHIAYFLACVHWFNPMIWVAYLLMCRDMEMSCDERVILQVGMEEKKAYSMALLSIASGRKLQPGMPIAFSENNAKKRIVNVLNYRKPAFWMAVAAGAVMLVLAVGLLCDPKDEDAREAVTTETQTATGTESGVAAESQTAAGTERENAAESQRMTGTESGVTAESQTEAVTEKDKSVEDGRNVVNEQKKGYEVTNAETSAAEDTENSMIFDSQFLEQVEQWIALRAKPNNMGFSVWFDEYSGGRLQNLVENDGEKFLETPEGVIFYQVEKEETPREVLQKMIGFEDQPIQILYDKRLWLIEYQEEVYLLMRFQNTYRLQRFEEMMTYKEKEVELQYVPIYTKDLEDKVVLSEKLSEGINAVFLFDSYMYVDDMNPVNDIQVVFDNISGYWEEGTIDYYFDEETFYEAMARKMGQSLSEFLEGHNLEWTPYKKIYRGQYADSMWREVEVTDVKWLDAYRAEIYYTGTYYDGVVVMKVYNGEMVFVSHQRIYE